MPADLRRYLLDRFTTDAATLRERAATLGASPASSPANPLANARELHAHEQGARMAGPDAAASLRMAAACDDVVAILAALPEHGALRELTASLRALAPLLDARAEGAARDAMVRSVYAGAATRLREVVRAESTATTGTHDDDDDAEGND